MNQKIRQILIDFFEEPTPVIAEFLYGSEGKKYKAEEINPILNQITKRFVTTYAVLKAECADAYFIAKTIYVISQVLAAYSY